jgi:hypothetical protein
MPNVINPSEAENLIGTPTVASEDLNIRVNPKGEESLGFSERTRDPSLSWWLGVWPS